MGCLKLTYQPVLKVLPRTEQTTLSREEKSCAEAYKYEYNGKEFQDELGLNVTAMDFRNYDNAIGRFNVQDRLSELAPMHNPYRFGFNNPVYWSDPTGLWEETKNGIRITNPDEIKSYLELAKNNPNATNNELIKMIKFDQTGSFTQELEAVTVKYDKKSETMDNLGKTNDVVGGIGDYLDKGTKYKGGSFAIWNSTSTARAFDGIKYNELKFRYSLTNTGFNQYTGKGVKVAKVLKKGSIVATVVLGTIEVGQGVAQDYENYENTGYTNGKNTAVASASVAGGVAGAWAGAEAGAAIGAGVGAWFAGIGAVPGGIVGGIVGGFIGGYTGSEVSETAVEKAYEE